MSLFATSLGALLSGYAVLFVLGAGRAVLIQLIAAMYPKGDPRRAELVAEMAYVETVAKLPESALWLGSQFVVAARETFPFRARELAGRWRPKLIVAHVTWTYRDGSKRRGAFAVSSTDALVLRLRRTVSETPGPDSAGVRAVKIDSLNWVSNSRQAEQMAAASNALFKHTFP